MKVGEGRWEWMLSGPAYKSATKSPQKRGQRQELQVLFPWASLQDWSQGVLLWDPGNTGYTAKKAALPLFTAGHQAGLTFWKLGATTRESVCVLQVKKSLEQPAEQCGLVTGLSQMPMGIASLNAVGSYPTALSPSSWLAEPQFCSGSNVLSSHEWIMFGQILSWQLQFPFALGWSRGGNVIQLWPVRCKVKGDVCGGGE